MEAQNLASWIGLALGAIALLGHLKNFFGSDAKANSTKIVELEKRVDGHDRANQTFEETLKHLPDQETAHRLELIMTRLGGRLDTLDERLKPVDAISQRLQEFLLDQVKAK